MQTSSEKIETYLGDGVYAGFDGSNIILTTSNGLESTNEIYLEDRVLDALQIFRERCGI